MNNNDYKELLLKQYYEIFEKIDSLIKSKGKLIVAIDGNSGAGKSTITNLLQSVYDCNVFHMDDFFLRPEQKTEERLKEVGGNFDYERFNNEIIDGLKSNQGFKYQIYNCKTQKLEEYVSVNPKRLNLIEGVYSMHPTLIDNYDLKIFLDLSPEEQSNRILKRNGEIMHQKFINVWIPLENAYFREFEIQEKSDIIIDTSDFKK